MSDDYSCPICAKPARQARPWLSVPVDVKSGQAIETGELVWCDICDIGFMRRLPTAEETAAAYDLGRYYTHGETHFPQVSEGISDRILIKLAYLRDQGRMIDAEALLAARPGAARILDIGCGTGNILASLAGEGRVLTGIEPDPEARKVASRHGIEVLDGTAEQLPDEVSDRQFDIVILSHVLEHTSDPERALSNIRKLLAPGGVVYSEVPNCGSIYFQRNAEISEMLDLPRHLHFFTAASLARVASASGLFITDWRFHGFTRHFGGGWRAWENRIHDMLREAGSEVKTPRRSYASSLSLLAAAAFAAPERKYDCIGFFARKAG